MDRTALQEALAVGASRPFHEAALRLLNCLGFRSDRTLPDQTGRVADLPDVFCVNKRTAKTARDFRDEAVAVHVLFQLGDDEIREAAQPSLLEDARRFDAGSTKSFLFVAVELRGTRSGYSRTRYSQFAREVNQGLAMPAFVLFRDLATRRLALAFVDRRPNKRDSSREVLGRVSLIRDIDPPRPHRAHLDILSDLSLKARLGWMKKRGKSPDFDGLRAAVLDALDTAELNKRFYKELFAWFEWAVDEATFPTDPIPAEPNRTVDPEHHVIRLITRLMFIWFIKAKNLVADELFVEEKVASLLKDYDPAEGDSYYRAVLQNLFFATLNTELNQREFSSRSQRTHRVHGLYRYKDLMADPGRLLELFHKTPFINGGLFECLDSSDRSQSAGGYRIDCFTDNEEHRTKLSVPNRLFFGNKGLIPLFERYRFTVEENTPIEKEVALDPELLGSVFENLLAAVNPETKKTARKESGSFYTPRPVVDYMVSEALLLSLMEETEPLDGNHDFWRESLQYLLDPADAFNDAEVLFESAEREAIVKAVADLTVLDPAVGSGAFLLSMLHALTLVLRRIDPENELWRTVQRRRAGDQAKSAFLTRHDDLERKAELQGLDATFRTYRTSDFGRKLFLIQNCLHGVDIQPIACLIAKLRLFISLAIEQKTSQDPKANYGIRPLPNLETRIIAANTLVGVPAQASVRTPGQARLETDLRQNREHHFHARTWAEKQTCRHRDEALRHCLKTELVAAGLPATGAERIATWNPYDQNANAHWFDPKYMFGLAHGFDLVVANPPYLESRSPLLPDELKSAYIAQAEDDWHVAVPRGSDLLIYFFWRAARVLADTGWAVFVTQNGWLTTDYGQKFQKSFSARARFARIVDSERKFFPDAKSQNINTVVSVFSTRPATCLITYRLLDASLTKTVRERQIATTSASKWGHQIAVSDTLRTALRRVAEDPSSVRGARAGGAQVADLARVSYGQGLNFPKSAVGAGRTPIVWKRAQFVNLDHETTADVSVSKTRQPPALFMPRGVGQRYYCTMNLGRSYTSSDVELYLPEHEWETDLHYCLWAYMNSTLVWLYRETTGRTNLGGGMLKAEAADMKGLPVPMRSNFGDAARRAFDLHQVREPLPVAEELASEEHLFLDEIVFGALGVEEAGEAMRRELLKKVADRSRKAKGLA